MDFCDVKCRFRLFKNTVKFDVLTTTLLSCSQTVQQVHQVNLTTQMHNKQNIKNKIVQQPEISSA